MKGSREEPGCLRFDLLDHGDGTYSFYEIYKDAAAMDHHKTLPHCTRNAFEFCGLARLSADARLRMCADLGWADFKKKNQAVADSQTVLKFGLLEPK